jgi:hypothetical protein
MIGSCPTCHGRGLIVGDREMGARVAAHVIALRPGVDGGGLPNRCPACGGSGKVPQEPTQHRRERRSFRWTGSGVEPTDWTAAREALTEIVSQNYRTARTATTVYEGHVLRGMNVIGGEVVEALLYIPQGAIVEDEHVAAVEAALGWMPND